MKALRFGAALAVALSASHALGQEAREDHATKALRELTARAPDDAFAFCVVRPKRERRIETAGRFDARQPFGEWARVPLGTTTLLLFEHAIGAAADAGEFDWKAPVGELLTEISAPLADRTWTQACRSSKVELPWYHRFVEDRAEIRPLSEVVTAHAFELTRYERSPDPAMIEVALLQLGLERATKRSWQELLGASAKRLGMHEVRDLTAQQPSARLLRGRAADGESAPVRITEVGAFGNATVTLQDLAALAEACRAEAFPPGSALDAEFRVAPLTREFSHSDDEIFGIERHSLRSRHNGVTVYLEIVRAADAAFFVVGNRAKSDWLEGLREAIVLDLLGSRAAPRDEAVWASGAVGLASSGGPDWPGDTLRARVPVGDDTLELDIEFASRSKVRAEARGIETGPVSADIRWYSIEVEVPLPDRARPGEKLSLFFTLSIDPDDPDALHGVVGEWRRMNDGTSLERLPRPVRFEPIDD